MTDQPSAASPAAFEPQPAHEIPPAEAEIPAEATPPAPRRSLLVRLGCAGALVIWFALLLTPILLIVLAAQGEIGLWYGARVPDSEAHPLLQVRLLMDIDNQGFSLTHSSINAQTATSTCMQTDVRYFLWEGEGENASYCDCYARADPDAPWAYLASSPGACGADAPDAVE
jgi:hypothetical protein